jgi:ComF family protein
MTRLERLTEPLIRFLFPHICEGCGTDILPRSSNLCSLCISQMPETYYELIRSNPVEKKFYGRLAVRAATAQFYFSRESLIQHLIHQFKYRGNQLLGLQLGKLMGQQLLNSGRFNADALVPVPLFDSKERKRGFNQATLLCRGISEIMDIPLMDKALIRIRNTDSQTRKGRMDRWENMEGKFTVIDPARISNRHLLLVDDVITTGATLEACGQELLNAGGSALSIATLCVAMK